MTQQGLPFTPTSVGNRYGRLKCFHDLFPQFFAFIDKHLGDFNGFSMMVSDKGGYLAILKRFGFDGKPEIMFVSAPTIIDLLMLVEDALAAGHWREDKPRKR